MCVKYILCLCPSIGPSVGLLVRWPVRPLVHRGWGGVGINLLWKCQSDISPDHAQSQNNLRTRRKSSWDFIIYSRANPTFPIVKYRSFLFLFLLPIHYNVNKGCGTTVNDMVLPLFPFTCVYILFLCTLWPYVRLAFPKFVVTDPPQCLREHLVDQSASRFFPYPDTRSS